MDRWIFRRAALVLGFVVVVFAMTAGLFVYGYGQALGQLARRGEADLALAADRLTGQLRRYQEMAVLLADHPTLTGDRATAEALLLAASDKTAALNLIYVDRQGQVLARANTSGPGEVAAGPWVARAMQGALGSGHGLYGARQLRAHFYAAPRFGADGQVKGALIVVVDLAKLEDDWRGSRPAVFFVDEGGEVFVSNRSEILFWRREAGQAGLQPAMLRPPAFEAVKRSGHDIWRIDWGAYIPRESLHLVRDLPVIGMQAEALVGTGPAKRIAMLQAVVFAALWLVFGAFLFLAMERRRTLAEANRLLEARVEARTQELKRAQADLVQAGKLSALGQMSAGISHELNQPLMAIRQFAENGEAFIDRGKPEKAQENLGRISALAARAARIIKNLRAFARNESEPMGRVDLVQVIENAVELTQTRLKSDRVRLIWDRTGEPIYAYGGEVRLTQVFVNLINNAADAMSGQEPEKTIRIAIEKGPMLQVTVEDSGPGIADPERMFEPFYSTKEVGSEEGMGLGLSISYGLVQSFGGNIRGRNGTRGAVFTVELDQWREEQAA
ncbi:ATP-binding protein [Alisedimentitalea sp. MJ-SS2]|uniref:sensor histidine kinase n=1 Tax=Aliisedimentitalea sp. MJ-SS2 TaxID=3049795 RepID=UPI00290D95D7|nr:ATP-binding protein [Alisedimentitalea sp. MJ-SS2]MDU8926706.1 ATP-binding protein [Alisedimentitalea sp. MJ-SS2]